MDTLTIYSKDFEVDGQNGFNGMCFLENMRVSFNSLQEALSYVVLNNVVLKEILYCYSVGDDQMFVRCPMYALYCNGSKSGSNPEGSSSNLDGATKH